MLADARTSVPTCGMRLECSTIAHWMGIDKRAPYPAAPHHPSIVVAVPCAGLASKNKRIICNACNNQPPNSRDARSSVRTNEQPNRIRSVTYVVKHNLMIIIRLYGACGRSNERPYWLVG